jgi:hypothetical protein
MAYHQKKMEIKNYDDMIVVECNRDKFAYLFEPPMSESKWIDINGKNFFATSITNFAQLRIIVDEINKRNVVVNKYNNNLEMKIKEEYYKSFDSRPINFSAELKRRRSKTSAKSLSSSVYDDDTSSSSDGFPSPGTPGKKKNSEGDDEEEDDLDYLINKMNELEERIEKLEEMTTN